MHVSVVEEFNKYIVVNETIARSPKARNHKAARPRCVDEVQLWLRSDERDTKIGTLGSAQVYGVIELTTYSDNTLTKIFIGARRERIFSCGICNILSPEMFLVPDEEWQHFVIPQLQDKWLCRPCYDELKELFPNGWRSMSQ